MLGFAYPDTWKSLGSILSVLGLYAGFGHLWILNTDAFKAIGRPDIMARIYAPVAAVMLPIYWWSSQLGLLEFTIARSSVILVGLLPHTYYAVRYLGLRKDYLWGILRAPLLASLPMAICVWIGVTAFRELLASGGPEVPLLLLGLIALGAGVYWATLRRLSPDFASRAQGLLKRSMSAGSARDPENA
jgi:predicted small integral membrane protein